MDNINNSILKKQKTMIHEDNKGNKDSICYSNSNQNKKVSNAGEIFSDINRKTSSKFIKKTSSGDFGNSNGSVDIINNVISEILIIIAELSTRSHKSKLNQVIQTLKYLITKINKDDSGQPDIDKIKSNNAFYKENTPPSNSLLTTSTNKILKNSPSKEKVSPKKGKYHQTFNEFAKRQNSAFTNNLFNFNEPIYDKELEDNYLLMKEEFSKTALELKSTTNQFLKEQFEKQKINNELIQKTTKYDLLKQKYNLIEKALKKLNSEYDRLSVEYSICEGQVKEFSSQKTIINEKYNILLEKTKEKDFEIIKNIHSIDSLQKELKSKKEALVYVHKKEKDLKKENEEINKEKQILKNETEKLSSKIKIYRELNNKLEATIKELIKKKEFFEELKSETIKIKKNLDKYEKQQEKMQESKEIIITSPF